MLLCPFIFCILVVEFNSKLVNLLNKHEDYKIKMFHLIILKESLIHARLPGHNNKQKRVA